MKRSLPLGTFLLAMFAGTTLNAALEESDKSWIGEFTADPSGWDHHSSMGWLWSIRTSETNVWLYSATYREWQWTGEGTYPSLWSENLDWLYYLAGESPASNWFYLFSQESWIGGEEWKVTEDGIAYVRTPESFFRDLPDWPYDYRYVEIDGLRQAYAEAGPADGPVVLLLHGQPTWSYLYRKMIPVLAEAGYRVIAMDHLGMGRSDKPIDIDDYTYLGHNARLEKFIQALALRDINLFVQDWGSLIGLRVAGLNPEWFASIGVGNGALPVWPAGTQVHPVVENPDEILDDLTAPYALMPDQQPLFYNGCELLFPRSEDGFAEWMEYAMKSSQYMPGARSKPKRGSPFQPRWKPLTMPHSRAAFTWPGRESSRLSSMRCPAPPMKPGSVCATSPGRS